MTKSPVSRLRTPWARAWRARRGDQRGVTTAEYAVVTAAGCGFGGVLIKLLTSDWGEKLLKRLFEFFLQMIGLG